MYPGDRRYTRDFTWLQADGTRARLGITEHLREILNDIVAIELPEAGRRVARNEAYGSVETAKAATELTAPAGGTIVSVNTALRERLGDLVSNPHGTWIVELELADPSDLNTLLSNTEFDALVQRETRKRPAASPRPAASGRKRPPTPSRPPARPRARTRATAPAPPSPAAVPAPPARAPADKVLTLAWSVRLGGHRLKGGDDAFGDRDYGSGSYFSWRERDIAFTSEVVGPGTVDQQYRWRDTRWTRVSTSGLSSTTSSHTDYRGTWKIEVDGRQPFLVLQDRERGRLRYRLDDHGSGGVLLDGRPYQRVRL